MNKKTQIISRVFRTSWFTKAAKKAHISDMELCDAVEETMQGKSDDLGGGVFKKRLNNNLHRSIILSKSGHYWVFEYLFAKNKRDNIEDDELEQFRHLAKVYSRLTEHEINQLTKDGDLREICHDC